MDRTRSRFFARRSTTRSTSSAWAVEHPSGSGGPLDRRPGTSWSSHSNESFLRRPLAQIGRWDAAGEPHAVDGAIEVIAVGVHSSAVDDKGDGRAVAGADSKGRLGVGREMDLPAGHG